MANKKIILVAGNSGSTASDIYIPAAECGINTAVTVEAQSQITYKTAGTFSNLFINLSTNAAGSSTTFKFRKNGADGNQTITISTGATGYHEDTTNSDTVAVNDTACYFYDRAAASIVSQCGTYFQSDDHIKVVTCSGSLAAAVATTTSYMPSGYLIATNTASRHYVETASTIRNMSVYISANTWTNSTSFRTSINGSAGNLLITVATATTGEFFDTSNSDSLSVADEWYFQKALGAGSGSITNTRISAEVVVTDKTKMSYNGGTHGASPNVNGTFCCMLGSYSSFSASNEARNNFQCPEAITASNFRIYINTNSLVVACTFTLRKNSANTALVITVTSGSTGRFSDTTNTVDYAENDTMNMAFGRTGAGGSIQPRDVSILFTYASGFTQTIRYY